MKLILLMVLTTYFLVGSNGEWTLNEDPCPNGLELRPGKRFEQNS